jgi:hypothetical protein
MAAPSPVEPGLHTGRSSEGGPWRARRWRGGLQEIAAANDEILADYKKGIFQ